MRDPTHDDSEMFQGYFDPSFHLLRCRFVVLRIPTTEAALDSMTNDEKAELILANDSNADVENLDESGVLADCIRAMFGDALDDEGVPHSLLPPSWERTANPDDAQDDDRDDLEREAAFLARVQEGDEFRAFCALAKSW